LKLWYVIIVTIIIIIIISMYHDKSKRFVNLFLQNIPALVERVSSVRELLYPDLRNLRQKVSFLSSIRNVVLPLPNLGTSERPCKRPRGHPLNCTITSACIIILLFYRFIRAEKIDTKSSILTCALGQH